MKKIVEKIVVRGICKLDLDRAVNKRMERGYIPLGGIKFNTYYGMYQQVMIKEEDKN